MVAFRAISTALAVAAITQSSGVLATYSNVDFSDNYVSPGQIKPFTKSHGYRFDCFDLLGGVLDTAGNVVESLLANLGISLGGKPKNYGHPVSIVGGYDNHYKQPSRIWHETGKPFNVLSLKALCCAADFSQRCNILDCHIKLTGYDKISGGNKIYDHDFYVPKNYNNGKDIAAIEINVLTDGVLNLGVLGHKLDSVVVEIQPLDILDIDVNTKENKQHHGHYNSQPRREHGTKGVGLVLDIDLDLDVKL
ncbi:hypothetical protein ABW20_dc0106042 [Dactylellina cionopaga]|nr:hypothetical protein ABW20_dc0106042 [Dactylellina cionopaga]